MTKQTRTRPLARAKGRPQQLLITYLRAPANTPIRVSFPSKTGPANARTDIYALRNALLEALPCAADLFWIPSAYSGQPLRLENRLRALSMRIEENNILCIHDGSAYSSINYTILEGAPQLIAPEFTDPSLPPADPAKATEDERIAAEVAEYERIKLQERIDRAIAYIKKAEAAKGTVMEMVYNGGRGQEDLEAARQLLAEHSITI